MLIGHLLADKQGQVVAQGFLDVLGHRPGEHGIQHDLGQWPQPPDNGRHLGDVLTLQRAVPQAGGDHVACHRGGHVVRGRVHVHPQPLGEVEYGRQRHACRHHLGPRAQQPGAGHPVADAVWLQDAQGYGPGPVLRSVLRAEQLPQPLRGQVAGDLIRPRVPDGGLKVEDLGQIAAAFPDGQHFTDVGERVAALEQLADQPQAGQVRVGVDADPPVAARRGKQPAILVDADVADGGIRPPCQLVDAVLAHALPVVPARRSARAA
jgi:hypothetical protein